MMGSRIESMTNVKCVCGKTMTTQEARNHYLEMGTSHSGFVKVSSQ